MVRTKAVNIIVVLIANWVRMTKAVGSLLLQVFSSPSHLHTFPLPSYPYLHIFYDFAALSTDEMNDENTITVITNAPLAAVLKEISDCYYRIHQYKKGKVSLEISFHANHPLFNFITFP